MMIVMPGLEPGIHDLSEAAGDPDARDEPSHDRLAT
jgi:hypothetical protein